MDSSLTEEDIKDFEYILALTRASSHAKTVMMRLYKKYIDSNHKVCMTCDVQVRIIHKKIKKYYNDQT